MQAKGTKGKKNIKLKVISILSSKNTLYLNIINCPIIFSTIHTQQVLDQLWVRHKWFRVSVDGVSAVLNLSQGFKITQHYIA